MSIYDATPGSTDVNQRFDLARLDSNRRRPHPSSSKPGLRGFSPEVTLEDRRLVVSELVANSWRHGPGGPIRLRLESNGSGTEGRVEDEGSEWFAMRESTDEGGLGLHIVDALASTGRSPPAGVPCRSSSGPEQEWSWERLVRC
jgi:hypothetical protein